MEEEKTIEENTKRTTRKEENEKNRKRTKKIIIIIGICIIVLLCMSTVFAVLNMTNEKVINGVYISDINVSNLTKKELEQKLQEITEEMSARKIVLKYQELETAINLNDIDLQYNLDEITNQAYNIGRDSNIFVNNFAIIKSTLLKTKLNMDIKYNEELIDGIDKYWGKYTFLSLLSFETIEKNKEYIDNNISKNIIEVINEIWLMTVHVDKGALRIMPDGFVRVRKLNNIQKGIVKKDKLSEIKKYENVLNIFFTQAYADIKEVKYEINEKEDRIHYELYFNKMIGGTLKSIPIELESEGTKKIIEEFDTLIGAIMGETVVIDEIDNGINDLLMKNIILSIKDEITGQLIITTHNTLLLEILPKECIYILSADYEGNKYINSIKEYGITIQKNHNARDLYFKGLFGGIPTTSYVDFEEIKYVLEDSEEKEEKNNGEET